MADLAPALLRAAASIAAREVPAPADADLAEWALRGLARSSAALSHLAAPGRARRDALLHAIWRRHWPTFAVTAAAEQIAAAARRYEASAWRVERVRGCTHAPESLHADLFALLSIGEVPGPRRIMQILGLYETESREIS